MKGYKNDKVMHENVERDKRIRFLKKKHLQSLKNILMGILQLKGEGGPARGIVEFYLDKITVPIEAEIEKLKEDHRFGKYQDDTSVTGRIRGAKTTIFIMDDFNKALQRLAKLRLEKDLK